MKKASWKTTLGGILLAAGQFIPHDSLPVSWQWLPAALTGIGGLILGATARDNSVTSEQASAK